MDMIKKFFSDESGATMVEYAILVALISIAAIVIVYVLGTEVRNSYNDVKECLQSPTDCGIT